MKQLIFIHIALLILTTGAQAATIDVGDIKNIYVANGSIESSNSANCDGSPTATGCNFEQTFHAGTYLSNTELHALVTTDFRTSVKSPVNNSAFIDLTFTNTIVNGAGNDLVLFFIGNTTTFGLDTYDLDGGLIGSGNYTIATPTFDTTEQTVSFFGDTVRDDAGDWLCINSTDSLCTGGYALSAIFIDFGKSLEGTAIGKLHLKLENSNFALAGGFHTTATVVPLPLSVVLFSSGLALLGWIGRRRTT